MKRCALLLLVSVSPLWADFAPPKLTPTQKTTAAALVFVGTITDVDKDPVNAPSTVRGTDKADYTMVTIKVNEALVGTAGLTQVRMGVAPLNLGRRGQYAIEGLETKKDYKACFFLVPHPTADFMVCYPWAWPLNATSPTFEKDLAEVRTIAKMIEEPVAALQANDKEARARAVYTLLTRYNTAPFGSDPSTAERGPISAEESKLILKVMKELPFVVPVNGVGRSQLWYHLRLTDKDGWVPPKYPAGSATAEEVFDPAMRKWLDQYGDKFIVQRYLWTRKK